MAQDSFTDFDQFYRFYLGEHQNTLCRRLHFIGSTLAMAILLLTLITGQWWGLLAVPLAGYGFAWFGHFVFEKNRPATFHYPLRSLRGDVRMYGDILKGRVPF